MGGILEHDRLGVLIADKVAGGEQFHAADLKAGGGGRALVATIAEVSQVVGADLGLLEQRCYQSEGVAAMLHALAHCVDGRVETLHRVAHHNTALAVQAGLFCQRDVGADADGHYYQVRIDLPAILQFEFFHPLIAEQCLGVAAGDDLKAASLQFCLQQFGRLFIELALHQHLGQVDHGDIHAVVEQTVGRLETEQAAADDHGVFIVLRRGEHGVDIGDGAKTDHAFKLMTGDRQDEGQRTGGNEQAVVLRFAAIGGDHLA